MPLNKKLIRRIIILAIIIAIMIGGILIYSQYTKGIANMTPSSFESLYLGISQDEVKARFGKPDIVSTLNLGQTSINETNYTYYMNDGSEVIITFNKEAGMASMQRIFRDKATAEMVYKHD